MYGLQILPFVLVGVIPSIFAKPQLVTRSSPVTFGQQYVCPTRPDGATKIDNTTQSNIFIQGYWYPPKTQLCVCAWLPLKDGSHGAAYIYQSDTFNDFHYDDYKADGWDLEFAYSFPDRAKANTEFQIAVSGEYGPLNTDPNNHYGWHTEDYYLIINWAGDTPPSQTAAGVPATSSSPPAGEETPGLLPAGSGSSTKPTNQGNLPGGEDGGDSASLRPPDWDAGGSPFPHGHLFPFRRMGINGNSNYDVEELPQTF